MINNEILKSKEFKPIISLIIPTHLRSKLLRRALNSVNSQAHRGNIEVICVSDSIDSNTDEVCSELLGQNDIYIRRNGQFGPSESRNIGLKHAKGQYVMFLDDDDAWQTDFINHFFNNLSTLSESIYYFNCKVIKESRPISGPITISEQIIKTTNCLNEYVFVKNQVHMSCFIFPRVLLEEISFDSSLRAYEDWDFLLAVFKRKMPTHIELSCSIVYEVDDNTTDRRGSSSKATDFNAVIDYLYIYRRHTAPNLEIQHNRQKLLASAGLNLSQELL
jgi:GalNAc5-diNAcBac-PP-undecaprenol beta-1,3-glucosyltransferase